MLLRVFSVLQRVGAEAQAVDMRAIGVDETQVQQRAFRSLRSLLVRLSRRMPIVWFVDDLQWGDADSAEALFEVLRPASSRGERTRSSPQALAHSTPTHRAQAVAK